MATYPVVEFLLSGFTDNSGNPLAGGLVYTYLPGTTTPKSTYVDDAGVTPEANPVVLDANGKKQIYANGSYKFVVKTAAGSTLYTFDNVAWPDYSSVPNAILVDGTATVTQNIPMNSKKFTGLANGSANTDSATIANVNTLSKQNCIAVDGTSTVAANIPMSTFKFTGLGSGSARTDSASLANLQDNLTNFASSTGGSADAQTITLSPAITAYVAGLPIWFIASATNTTTMTLNVNGVGAKNLLLSQTGAACKPGNVTSGRLYCAVYDGTQFQLLNPTHVWTSYTPTITQSVGLTISGMNSQYKIVDNNLVVWEFFANFTSAGTAGNALEFSLPVNAASAATYDCHGSALILDNSAAFIYTCAASINTTSTLRFFSGSGTTANFFGIAPAITIAASDSISFTVSYRI